MRHPNFRSLAALALIVLLGACVRLVPPTGGALPAPRPAPATPAPLPGPTPTPPANALTAGVRPGPPVATLGLDQPGAARVLAAFVASCPRIALLPDRTGLVRPEDWTAACSAAANWPASDAPRFFAENFESAIVGEGKTFVTGYYEPEISGVRVRQPGFDVPVYALPPDLVRANTALPPPIAAPVPLTSPPAQQPPTLGRYDASGAFVPYWSRAEIEDGALAGRGLEIAWAADPAEFFFLQIQGSGRLVGPDGQVMRIGYAGQNGLPYTAIGALIRARGLLGDGPGQYASSMQGIVRYLHEHPAEGRALMREDASYVFFRELTGLDPATGPVGAMNLPVRAQTSLAADPRFVPWGAPVFLTTDRPPANGLWIAQDTGGAIRGPNRFDSFWGAGAEARRIAGGLDGRGTAVILLPRGVLARVGAPPPLPR